MANVIVLIQKLMTAEIFSAKEELSFIGVENEEPLM